MIWRGFGSDNHSGVHPEILAAIERANEGHSHGYGDDPWTREAQNLVREELGAPDAQVAFVMNGTGANCVGLAAVCRPWESVICPATAHLNTDECAAPERVAGVKLVSVATPDGKLTPELVRPHLQGFGFEHSAQPRAISISQATELGTAYTPDEIAALARLAHEHGMMLHVDGARLANAAAGLGVSLARMVTEAGVDVLSFGGTKNGMLFGEAVVLLTDDAVTDDLRFVRKQLTQLASKHRFIAAQFSAALCDGLWHRTAAHANAMAARLADGARAKGIEIAYPVQANEVFAVLPQERIPELQARFHFYTWAGDVPMVRWVTSWDTTEQDVDALLDAV
jgi:threonine aldolase